MLWSLSSRLIDGLPRLGWIASTSRGSTLVELLHGKDVEVGPTWAVEGVWDGPFADGEFERSLVFFGTGLKLLNNGVVFATSRDCIGRLFYCEIGAERFVSNSLLLLLARTGARLDTHHLYVDENVPALHGVDDLMDTIRIVHPRCHTFRLQIYNNLNLTALGFTSQRVDSLSSPSSYDGYRNGIRAIMEGIGRNMRAPERRSPMAAYATMSTGYDSSAATALARPLGIECAYTSKTSSSAVPRLLRPSLIDDDATDIGRSLGIEMRALEPIDAGDPTDDEVYFLAVNRSDSEAALMSMTRDIAGSGKVGVVCTGYHGDNAWGRTTDDETRGRRFVRSSTSGQSLLEIRLHAGFVNLPVPFLYCADPFALAVISNAAEMAPWQLNNDYDRPIPRRVLEEAGVPREAFGWAKKGLAKYRALPQTRHLRNEFCSFVGLSPRVVQAITATDRLLYLGSRGAVYAAHVGNRQRALHTFTSRDPLGERLKLGSQMLCWAADRLAAKYQTVITAL